MKKKYVFTVLFALSLICGKVLQAQFIGGVKDSLRVLCVKYDKSASGIGGVVSMSSIMECDSLRQPSYIVGDSIVPFFSDIRVDCIKSIQFLYGKKLPKKLQKSYPNGLVSILLKEDETFNTVQVVPDGDNLSRQAFVTRVAFSDMADGTVFASKISDLVDKYGTDDGVFREYKYFNPNRATPILAVDSLEKKAFVRSFSDFRSDAVEDMVVYDSQEAQKIVGNRGVNGLVVVAISPKYTLAEALFSPLEKVQRLIVDMYTINIETMMMREVVYINE